MPHAENAATYPSHDAHSDEKVTIAIDLYNTSPKDDIFNTRYVQEGILPVFLVITNDGNKPDLRHQNAGPTRYVRPHQARRPHRG